MFCNEYLQLGGELIIKLIVSDLDGTLLNPNRELSEENIAALQVAQESGIEIAIATGRTYGNAYMLFQRAGLQPHIISNNGAFVHNKEGMRLKAVGMDKEHIRYALKWLSKNGYPFDLCTDKHLYFPADIVERFIDDYKKSENADQFQTLEILKGKVDRMVFQEGAIVIDNYDKIIDQDLIFGNISAFTLDAEKLRIGREYFNNYEGLAMTVAGNDIFEMIHPCASKGNALETLTQYLNIPLQEVMAIGDNHNDISMLEKVGHSVAMGNGEEAVKKICKYVSRSNEFDGVAYIINKLLGKSSVVDQITA